jgi:hypothetical protein
MSEPKRRFLTPMVGRSADEPFRVSTPLELFFDLCFVVAVAQAAAPLHHSVAEHHVLDGLASVPDGLLRHLVGLDELHLVRLGLRTPTTMSTGSPRSCRSPCAVLAAGVEQAFERNDFG